MSKYFQNILPLSEMMRRNNLSELTVLRHEVKYQCELLKGRGYVIDSLAPDQDDPKNWVTIVFSEHPDNPIDVSLEVMIDALECDHEYS